jgi:hypothetical protein
MNEIRFGKRCGFKRGVKLAAPVCGCLLAALLLVAPMARAQDEDVLTPEKSAAKAKQLIQQSIQALGGQTYLSVRDVTLIGRVGLFGHNGELTGYDRVFDYTLEPDKERTEYSKKRNIIDVFNGHQGWTLDKGGVSEATSDAVADFENGLKRDINNLFRYRLNEQGLTFRYAGTDVVDLRESDWIEVADQEARTIRFALDRNSHLPLRAIFITRDPATHDRSEEVEYFSNYQPVQGILTPFQDTRIRNGQKVYQAFWDECKYNTGLNPSLFTRESLEERWGQVGSKKQKKK